MFDTSLTTDKLDAALAKAQGEIEPAIKEKRNDHFRSSYADISAVWDACRTALSKHGISVSQWPIHSVDGRLHMLTRIAHAGEWMKAEFSIPIGKLDAHGYGSAVTYIKRFALAAAVGVTSDDPDLDDDGNQASGLPHKPQDRQSDGPAPKASPKVEKPATAKPAALTITTAGEAERSHITRLAAEHGWTHAEVADEMKRLFKKVKILTLTLPEYQELAALISSVKRGVKREDGFGPMFSENSPTSVFPQEDDVK